ncbi:MAG: hypothetical protein H6707_13885 [Deltaproteobacteria bacterium]|nr:hypothetical protein [Deltaproteobacteria bacterium]
MRVDGRTILTLICLTLIGSGEGQAAPRTGSLAAKPRVIIVDDGGGGDVALLDSLGARFALIELTALTPLMRQADDKRRIVDTIKAHIQAARDSLLRLKHDACESELAQAVSTVENSLVRFYLPQLAAEVYLWRGVCALRRVVPAEARSAFHQALHYDPQLKLGPYFSPQVRDAFSEATSSLPTAPLPSAAEMRQVLQLDRQAAGLLLIRTRRLDAKRSQLAVLALRPDRGAYEGVESVIIKEGLAASAELDAFIDRLTQRLGLQLAVSRPVAPRAKPWYKRWYLWVGAVVAVVAATTVASTLRRDTVDVSVSWAR